MKLKVINIEGKKISDIDISDKIFSQDASKSLIQSLVDWQLNHFKPRTAKTKQRGEIKGSTAKIYAQNDACEYLLLDLGNSILYWGNKIW